MFQTECLNVQAGKSWPSPETVERILDAAEQLFAEKGFAETSLHAVPASRGQSGGGQLPFWFKSAGLQAVFCSWGHFVPIWTVSWSRQGKPIVRRLRSCWRCWSSRALVIQPRSGNDLSIFACSGLAFSQSQGRAPFHAEDMYGKVFRRLYHVAGQTAPQIRPSSCSSVHFMSSARPAVRDQGVACHCRDRFWRQHLDRAGHAP